MRGGREERPLSAGPIKERTDMKRCAVTRLLTLLIAACLVLSLFGCAPKTDESQPASEPASTSQTPEDSKDDAAEDPAAVSESQPAAEEEKAEPAEEEKQAMTEQVLVSPWRTGSLAAIAWVLVI